VIRLLLLATLLQVTDPAQAAIDRRVRDVASEIKCVVCQGLSIQDSPSDLAQEMREVVREQITAGRTPEQVKAFFVERYGEQILLKPPAHGFNLIVYIAPVLMLLFGAVFIYLKARSWTAPRNEPG
jgi:cytochrome c-type biogenesis protein CcmH